MHEYIILSAELQEALRIIYITIFLQKILIMDNVLTFAI